MKRVFVAGHNGMVGSAIVRQLQAMDSIALKEKFEWVVELTVEEMLAYDLQYT